MLNYRVDDLDGMIAKLQTEGIYVGPRGRGPWRGRGPERSQDSNGRFAWVTDPEGHRIELWEPAPGH